MAHFSILAQAIFAVAVLVFVFVLELCRKAMADAGLRKNNEFFRLAGFTGSFAKLIRLIQFLVIIVPFLLFIYNFYSYYDSHTLKTSDATIRCWPSGMLKCSAFEVNGKNLWVIFNVTDNISDIYSTWNADPAMGDTPKTYVLHATSAPFYIGRGGPQQTILCPMKSWKYDSHQITMNLECAKDVLSDMEDKNANSLGVEWKIGVSEPPQPSLSEQLWDFLSIARGDTLTLQKYYEGRCRGTVGTSFCEVTIGAEIRYND
ncbi:MAG: hypothetical protein HZB67_01750 [Candidatus Aenigmarchaeota archaeon]|nr:hypothetical protein [Candidatus Aenigmarchaeota archaeon]